MKLLADLVPYPEHSTEFPSSAGSRRRGLLALRAQNWRASAGPGPRPTPYPRVDYITSPGSAFIETRVLPVVGKVWTVEGEFMMPNNTNSVLCGTNNRMYLAWCVPGSGCRFYDGATTNPTSTSIPVSGEFFQIKTEVNTSAKTARIEANGVLVVTKSPVTIQSAAGWYSNITLFSASVSNWFTPAGSAARWVKISMDGELVRDMVAVRDGDEGCLYDFATEQLFRGTKKFGFVA